MDSSFGLSPHYQQKSNRNFDMISQATSSLGVPLKQVDIPCPFHMQEQSTNYCMESKCHQPLCSECIQDHLLFHKKQGYSDLGIKSLRGLRKECIARLGALIQQLVRRLGQLEPPIPPQQQLQNLQNNLESIRQKMHQIIESEINRIKESLRVSLAESANYFKSMAQIHSRLEDLIEQLRQNHDTLADGGSKGMSIPQCIKKTLTLDADALLDTFQKEGIAYEARRSKSELQIIFQPQLLRNSLLQTVKIITPQNLNSSTISMSNPSRVYRKPKLHADQEEQDQKMETSLLPLQAVPRGNAKLLHFFESGTNQLHLISVEPNKRGVQRVISISEFVVPSFHASIMSRNGEFIFLSGGIVELNGGAKSPLFIRFSIKTQTCKKDFAKVKPRSSHSLCEDGNGDIYILGGYGPEEFSGGDPSYQMAVERVNPRSGRVQIEASSNWGGSNISMFCRDHIVKGCEEGIELYNPKTKQWVISEIKTKPRVEYLFFKNCGFTCLTDSSILVFGGYATNTSSSDLCFSWNLTMNQRPRVSINRVNCRLPVAQGFENCCALVDQQGFYVLQNVQYDQEAEEDCCVDNERRLLRFNLREGSGDWKVLQIDEQ